MAFARYEQDFRAGVETVKGAMERIRIGGGGDRDNDIRSGDSQMAENQQLILMMENESRMMSVEERGRVQTKLKSYRSEHAALAEEYGRVKNIARMSAGMGGSAGMAGMAEGDRDRLLQANDKLNRTSDRIVESRRLAEETVQVGEGIMEDLHRQREVIVGSREKLSKVDDGISSAGRVLRNIHKRVVQDKIIMIGVIVVLVVLIAVIIYVSVSK